MGQRIEQHLNANALTTRQLELRLYLDDHTEQKSSQTLRQPTANGRLIGRALVRLSALLPLTAGVTGLAVTAKELAPVAYQQLDLFGTPAAAHHRLSDLLDALILRYSSDCIYQIVDGEPDHPLPEYRLTLEAVSAA
jgi:hypothetical protein